MIPINAFIKLAILFFPHANFRHSKSGYFCAINILLLKFVRRKMAKQTLYLGIEYVEMDKKSI